MYEMTAGHCSNLRGKKLAQLGLVNIALRDHYLEIFHLTSSDHQLNRHFLSFHAFKGKLRVLAYVALRISNTGRVGILVALK